MLAAVVVCYGRSADLPTGQYTEWTTEKDIFVSMRDGIRLDTDVWLPKGATGTLPTVLVRTPYDKDKTENQVNWGWTEFFVKHGFAVVLQSERGRHFSEGYYKNYLQGASTDGYDTMSWIVKQPWSNGKVGTTGCSSSAETQWPMAASNAPGHAAMITVAPGTAIGNVPGNSTRGNFYRGGVPFIGFWAGWYTVSVQSERLLLPANSTQEQRIRLRNSYSLMSPPSAWYNVPTMDQLPTQDMLRKKSIAFSPFDNYVTWTPADLRWNEVEQIGIGAKPRVPALLVETWQDPAVGDSTQLFKYLQDLGTPNEYLIIGPGPHCTSSQEIIVSADLAAMAKSYASEGESEVKVSDMQNTADLDLAHLKFGDLDIGDARYGGIDRGYTQLYLHWLDYWLKGEQNHVLDMPKVQLYVMGKGWMSSDQWPLKETRYTNYYLSADPAIPHREGAGLLSTGMPKYSNNKDSYVYNPGDPTPSLGGSYEPVAVDQRPIEARKDVLVYSTEPLEKSLTVVGPVEVVLYVSSSAKDTDFMVKLVDVYPDGKAIDLNNDAFRVRYRAGFDKKALMRPGEVYEITLPNMVTGIRFAKGHRIRLDIASSNFPNFERNLNTGGNNYDETKWVVAENSVHYGSLYPSRVVLPVLPD